MGDLFHAQEARYSLRHQASEARKLGLWSTARWADEMLIGLRRSDGAQDPSAASTNINARFLPDSLTLEETDAVDMALSLICTREWRRAAACMSSMEAKKEFPIQFLYGYTRYMSGEKSLADDASSSTTGATPASANPEAAAVLRVLENSGECMYCEWLRCVLYRRSGRKQDALSGLIKVVNQKPLFWSAWLELSKCVAQDADAATSFTMQLPDHWATVVFKAFHFEESKSGVDSQSLWTQALEWFPTSPFVLQGDATTKYRLRDYDNARAGFETLFEEFPDRLDGIDVYSNILYVLEDRQNLSMLSQRAQSIDRFSPEACIVMGNYFSLKGMNEKAVSYFKKALQLNPQYLSAYTLIGHEFVEMKNTTAAVQAYRAALNVDPRDFRAWYGLGQTHEILRLHHHALHYFRSAANLRPNDARMWCAVGQCLQQLKQFEEAMKAFKRAEEAGDAEGVALNELGHLHMEIGNSEAAKECFQRNLNSLDAQQLPGSSPGEQQLVAMRSLSRLHIDAGNCSVAEELCERMLMSDVSYREDAMSMLREIQGRNTDHVFSSVLPSQPTSPHVPDDDDMEYE